MYLSSMFCLNSRIVYLTFASKSRHFAEFVRNTPKLKGGASSHLRKTHIYFIGSLTIATSLLFEVDMLTGDTATFPHVEKA